MLISNLNFLYEPEQPTRLFDELLGRSVSLEKIWDQDTPINYWKLTIKNLYRPVVEQIITEQGILNIGGMIYSVVKEFAEPTDGSRTKQVLNLTYQDDKITKPLVFPLWSIRSVLWWFYQTSFLIGRPLNGCLVSSYFKYENDGSVRTLTTDSKKRSYR